jgi:hypothetical protein
MESKLKTFAEFQILGRIGKVREVGQTTRVSICANYAVTSMKQHLRSAVITSLGGWNLLVGTLDFGHRYFSALRDKCERHVRLAVNGF